MSNAEQLPTDNVHELDLTGQRVAGYRLKHRIGRGGMADVYLGEQESLRRSVALKVLRRSLAKNESYVRRFQHEAHAAASLVHGNIVQIHEVGSVGDVHYIAQEYVDGENLSQVLVRHGPFDERLAINILLQVTAALQKAADAGIVHRDIKPDNIMITKDGEVKVADFGLARINDHSVNLTQVGMTLGTPLYMSPEQVEGKPVDSRSDIYSLGITAFHMLAGEPPFRGENAFTVAVKHLKEDPPQLHDVSPHISSELCGVIHRMITKNRDERFKSPTELGQALRSLPLAASGQDGSAGSRVWNSAELATMIQTHLSTTQRLETVLFSQRIISPTRGTFWAFGVGALIAFGVGMASAWTWRPRSVLDGANSGKPVIQRMSTAREQFWLAAEQNTEDAWSSLENYFPPSESELNRLYMLRAKQRLADLLFEQHQFGRAKPLYDELASLNSDSDVQFQIAGLVGLANLHAQNEQPSSASRVLTLITILLPQLRKQNEALADEVRNRLKSSLHREFDQLQLDIP